jgi:hypothetical protein
MGTAGERHGNGRVCVNRPLKRQGNGMGTVGEWQGHGMGMAEEWQGNGIGTAWERQGMCEPAFTLVPAVQKYR